MLWSVTALDTETETMWRLLVWTVVVSVFCPSALSVDSGLMLCLMFSVFSVRRVVSFCLHCFQFVLVQLAYRPGCLVVFITWAGPLSGAGLGAFGVYWFGDALRRSIMQSEKCWCWTLDLVCSETWRSTAVRPAFIKLISNCKYPASALTYPTYHSPGVGPPTAGFNTEVPNVNTKLLIFMKYSHSLGQLMSSSAITARYNILLTAMVIHRTHSMLQSSNPPAEQWFILICIFIDMFRFILPATEWWINEKLVSLINTRRFLLIEAETKRLWFYWYISHSHWW